MKSTLSTVIAIFIVSLLVWTAFSITPYPLDQGSTVVVVGVVGLLIFGVRAMIANAKKSKAAKETAPKPTASNGGGEPHA
jgi:hypothetical protein